MLTRRPPWWMLVVSAAFLAYVSLVDYEQFWGTSDLGGIDVTFIDRPAGLVVRTVDPNSVAEQAGLRAGDRMLAVDGQPVRGSRDWNTILANREVGRSEHWEIARQGERLQLTIASKRIDWQESSTLVNLVFLGLTSATFFLGLLIAFRRPDDLTARIGAWLIATASIGFGAVGGWAATWRHLPTPIGVLLWIPQISRFVLDGLFFTFFAIFPAKLFRARWPWIVLWTPVLIFLPWRISAVYSVIYRPGHATEAPEWVSTVTILRTVIYLAGSVVALTINYRRLEDRNLRRRVRVLLAGTAVGLLAAIGFLVIGSEGVALPSWAITAQDVLLILCVAFPLSFAYAILRHRLFDIQVMIRQGLQYALARGAVLGLVPAMGVVLIVDLVVHSEQPLAAILRARGWVYIGLGVMAFAAHARRKQWLEALDRRFFRERYDAQRVLREVVDEVREARSFEQVAPRVVARIEGALHPEFVALLARGPREPSYRCLASAPSGHAPPPLPAESKLVALVRLLGKPLEVSLAESGWLRQQLPHEETDFVRQARFDLLVPITSAPERREALLALGLKRSEEPYTPDDRELLQAIAASLALLLERPAAAPVRVREAFEECPHCGTCYDTGTSRCVVEGASLLPMRLPRDLAGRYHLERRRGRGGMGAVYEATDSALDRRVAVKVIREDLAGTPEAAERFRREARAAAGFTHPHVVTVYDFGVDAETRAFLVMELLEGLTLREKLKREERLDAARVVEIMRGVCAAVDAAHRRQLVHRDLKPENIFLTRDETAEVAKVLDFGIAKFLPETSEATAGALLPAAPTGAGLLVGTLHYMSPEQLRGEGVEAAWDLWALAVVVYEMLTGAPPFAGATARECQGKVLAGSFIPLAAHLAEAPAPWQEFFARAFALDRVRRPTSSRRFFVELEQVLI